MDPAELTTPAIIALSGQTLLLLAGLVVLARLFFTRTGRAFWRRPSPLAPLPWTWLEFFMAAFVVIAGAVAGAVVSNLVIAALPLDEEGRTMVLGAGFQFGMLFGAYCGHLAVERSRPPDAIVEAIPPASPAETAPAEELAPRPSPWIAGPIALLAAFPLLALANLGWVALLEHYGLNLEKQAIVEIFSASQSPAVLLGMGFLAIVVAPVTEEIIFRAGLYRFLRTRIPRWAAVVLPALLFGTLHDSLVAKLPLVLLGIVFAIAYERTGRITVPIVAHALFNLNTILMLLAGVQF